MRADVDGPRVMQLLVELGRRLRKPHTLYLVGGSSAVVVGWRVSTRDIDVRPEPDSDELLRMLQELKRELDTDLADVRAMLARDLVTADELHEGFSAMRARLFRFPAVDEATLERRLNEVVGGPA